SKASKRQESFEAEIQGAITTSNPAKKRVVKKSKISMGKKRRVIKNKAIVSTNQRSLLPKSIPNLRSEAILQVEEPYVCLETNCVYEIHKTTTHLVARKPYGALIRRLYRSARLKRLYDQEQDQDEEQELYPDLECYHCCCSACCIECRYNLFVIVSSIFLGFHKASKFVACLLCDNKLYYVQMNSN
ncbi:GM23225, partial [Drosophila sechellia]